MSERRPGVPRLRHGAGVGVWHVCAEGTVHGPIVSRSTYRTQKFGKKELMKLWYTAGWESRSLGWVTGVDARATGTRRLHGRSREYSFSCTPGWRPVVSRAAFLHGRLQLSSGTTAMLDALSHAHCFVHRTERVQQQPTTLHWLEMHARITQHIQNEKSQQE